MHMLQSLFYLMIVPHASVIIITHLQEHKTTVYADRRQIGGHCSSCNVYVPGTSDLDKI